MQNELPEHSYALPPLMTAETAESLAESLLRLPLDQKMTVVLDASKVEQVASSGAQVLISLHKNLTASESEMVIQGHNGVFAQTLRDMGLGWLINAS